MKKLVILTTSLLLVSGGINATDTLNKLVETKIEQSSITMEAPAPLPIGVLKLMLKALKEAGTEFPYKKIVQLLEIPVKETITSSCNRAIIKVLIQDMTEFGIKISQKTDIEELGKRAKYLANRYGDNVLDKYESAKNFHLLITDEYYGKARIILNNPKNKNITLDELASQIRKEIAEGSNKKIDLGFAKNQKKPKSENNISTSKNLTTSNKDVTYTDNQGQIIKIEKYKKANHLDKDPKELYEIEKYTYYREPGRINSIEHYNASEKLTYIEKYGYRYSEGTLDEIDVEKYDADNKLLLVQRYYADGDMNQIHHIDKTPYKIENYAGNKNPYETIEYYKNGNIENHTIDLIRGSKNSPCSMSKGAVFQNDGPGGIGGNVFHHHPDFRGLITEDLLKDLKIDDSYSEYTRQLINGDIQVATHTHNWITLKPGDFFSRIM